MTRVKICGITRGEDARLAAAEGAHALGFIFFSGSPRAIPMEAAAEICASLPPFVSRVGVFVNETAEAIERIAGACRLDALQFHGDEPPDFCRRFPQKSIKAFRIRGREDLARMAAYDTDAWLLDAYADGVRGGTGRTFDWTLAAGAAEGGAPIVLSGGLHPANVAEAIRAARPFAVDVCSGVELRPGRKDPEKVRAFLRACRRTGDV